MGYVLLKVVSNEYNNEKIGDLYNLYVDEEYRGQNIGFELAGLGIKWLKEKGCSKIVIEIIFEDDNLMKFYGKLGFKPYTITFKN